MNNDYVENEMRSLESEMKCAKKSKIKSFRQEKIILILMIPLFFFTLSLTAENAFQQKIPTTTVITVHKASGRNFYCEKCDTACWQAEKNADWAGKFYCKKCGNQLN